jgi:hypothetical protein
MKILAIVLLLVGAAVAEQCEVLELNTNAALSATSGGVSSRGHRVYTVRLDKSIYQVVPQRDWFPRLIVGRSVDCRMKKIIIKDGYHYSILAEKLAPAQ